MRGGLWVLNVMAFAWVSWGLLLSGRPWLWLLVPAAISALLLLSEQRIARGGVPQLDGAHVGRVVAIWSAVQGVAIIVVANVLINLHRPDAIMPAVAIIVGLHFVGLAKGIPVRLYYATAAALIAVGAIALIAPAWHLPLATGVMAAATLWLSGIALARQSS